MKFTVAAAAIAGAAAVSAQSNPLAALPSCALQCSIQAAGETSCSLTDISCQCQLPNQAVIAPALGACLATACTNPADIAAATSAGEALCATVPQTAAATMSMSSPTAYASSSSMMMSSSSAMMTSSSAPATVAPVMSASSSSAAMMTSSPAAQVTSVSTMPMVISQITDGQIQAPTTAVVTTKVSNMTVATMSPTVAPYKGAAAGGLVAGVQALVGAAVVAAVAL